MYDAQRPERNVEKLHLPKRSKNKWFIKQKRKEKTKTKTVLHVRDIRGNWTKSKIDKI